MCLTIGGKYVVFCSGAGTFIFNKHLFSGVRNGSGQFQGNNLFINSVFQFYFFAGVFYIDCDAESA